MRLTVKERILLHLLESAQSADDPEVSPALAQEGVARGAGIERRHLAQFVRPLMEEGLVRERQAHVSGIRQRRKVYELTSSGRAAAARLREKVNDRIVRIREGDVVRQGSLHEALEALGTGTSLLEAVRQVEQVGVLDLETMRRPPESGFIEQTWDAPRLGAFVGRRQELAEVLRQDEVPRVFVIRGIPGIGKTAFAAKVCELLRGRKNLFWHRIRTWESDQTVLASLGQFLEALDRPALSSILKRGESVPAADVLRQDLPDTNAMLVFDDAHEASPAVASIFRMLAEAVASAPDVRVLILTRQALRFYDIRDVSLKGIVGEMELGSLPPEDAAALLADSTDAVTLAVLPHSLAGHPLFLELVRRHGPNVPHAVHDMHRFMEDAIYRNLTDPEKDVMKAASVYEVPLPRSTLLSFSGSSHEVLQALEDLALIRVVGWERYEIHDTIRDFLRDLLTPGEREEYGGLAATHLRELAAQASASGDMVASIACLSNALRLAQTAPERAVLCEALGDANGQIGDLLALSAAYREGLRLVTDLESIARLHRKLGSVLEDRGHVTSARGEVEAGLAALGQQDCPELGWLYLARARIAKQDMDWDAVEDDAERALGIFGRFGSVAGQAHALFEAGLAASWMGGVSEDGTPQAEVCFRAALDMAKAARNPVLEARVHLAMAEAIGYGSGDHEEGMRHYRDVESSRVAMEDPTVGPLLYSGRAWFLLRTTRDLAAAEEDLSESRRLAQKVQNAAALASVEYLSAIIAGDKAQYAEAGRYDEDAGSTAVRAGLMAYASDAYFCGVGFYLAADDWDGYGRISSILQSPQLSRYVGNPVERAAMHPALDALLRGDTDGFENGFATLLRTTAKFPVHSLYHTARLWWYHFYYSMGLRALGRDREADDQRQRALELVRSVRNVLAAHYLESDYAERITQAIRSRLESAQPSTPTASRSASARGSPTPSTSRRSSGRPGSRGGTSGRTTCGTTAHLFCNR